jgi:hypothetical protein
MLKYFFVIILSALLISCEKNKPVEYLTMEITIDGVSSTYRVPVNEYIGGFDVIEGNAGYLFQNSIYHLSGPSLYASLGCGGGLGRLKPETGYQQTVASFINMMNLEVYNNLSDVKVEVIQHGNYISNGDIKHSDLFIVQGKDITLYNNVVPMYVWDSTDTKVLSFKLELPRLN